MKIVSLKLLRTATNTIMSTVNYLQALLADENLLIADIPAPEKKVRKKRVKKNQSSQKFDLPLSPETIIKPKRGRRARHTFGEPKLREGETPV